MSLKVTNFGNIMKQRILLLILTASGLLAGRGTAHAQEPLVTVFKENYAITGIPLNARPNWDTNDLAFQVSLRYNAFQDIAGKGWTVFLGYTQLSVWDVYRASNPFRCSTYMPGIYAYHPFATDSYGVVNDILLGLEHRSNGYAGEKSRSIDCLFATYTHTFGGYFTAQFTGRFGIGSIYNTFSLEMFNRYQGYCNIGLCYHTRDRRFMASASATPLFLGDIPANVSAEIAWRPARANDWLYLVARYHYGYDEDQLDCANPEVFLKHMVRFGIAVQPSRISHKLCF